MPPGLDYFPNVPALPLSTNAKQVVFLRTLSKEIQSELSAMAVFSVFTFSVLAHYNSYWAYRMAYDFFLKLSYARP